MLLLIVFVLLLDIYVLKGISAFPASWRLFHKKWFPVALIGISAIGIVAILILPHIRIEFGIRLLVIVGFCFFLLFKTCFAAFLLIDDLRRLVIYSRNRLKKTRAPQPEIKQGFDDIPRSEFLLTAGLLAISVPLAGMRVKMKSGLYDYQIQRQTIYLPNLPKKFDGIKLGQISDIHSGSFFNHTAVAGGVDMLMREKSDFIFFTGDLVNIVSSEIRPYIDIFKKVKAPLGVYSSLGNHDYGDYTYWANAADKKKNRDEMLGAHKYMGWDLLLNDHRRLKVDGEEIGILGIENWGEFSKFPKYGRMDLAVKNTSDLPVKLLLSHDPSHWRAEVLPQYPQIDMVFAGHTHGMQLGVRTPDFQWSPVEYIYNEWAGHYQQGHQQLYVNVGYGFLAIPGRVGILPEITIFELKAGSAPQQITT
jgi:predicted MPP superfamily phosphohydrolase